jgi:hypothetical protein
MNKEKLKETLITLLGMFDATYNETLVASHITRENLCNILEGKNIPSVLPIKCLEKFVTIFKEESSRVHDEEIFYSGRLWDVKAILDDVDNYNINKSTKRLLGRLHQDCSYDAQLREMGAGELTGIALALMDGYAV